MLKVSSLVRWLFAAVLLVAAAFAGAYYVRAVHVSAVTAARDSSQSDTDEVASLDVGNVLGAQMVAEQLLGLAYRQVQRVYYKPVDPQSLVHGEHSGLESYLRDALKAKHVAVTPQLPNPQMTVDSVQGVSSRTRKIITRGIWAETVAISSRKPRLRACWSRCTIPTRCI